MAASKRARTSGKQQPGDHPSVPVEGGNPPARKSVAGRGARTRKVPEVDGPAAEVVPGLLPPPPGADVPNPREHPANQPDVWNAAIARALEEGYWKLAEWNPRIEAWTIPSQNDPTTLYILRRDRSVAGRRAYRWEHFKCTCPAAERGFLVCKHKAAMWLRREAMEKELRKQYDL